MPQSPLLSRIPLPVEIEAVTEGDVLSGARGAFAFIGGERFSPIIARMKIVRLPVLPRLDAEFTTGPQLGC